MLAMSWRDSVDWSGPLQESAIWIDESQTVNVRRLHAQLPMFSKDDDDPLGISDEGIQYVQINIQVTFIYSVCTYYIQFVNL